MTDPGNVEHWNTALTTSVPGTFTVDDGQVRFVRDVDLPATTAPPPAEVAGRDIREHAEPQVPAGGFRTRGEPSGEVTNPAAD